MRSSGTEALCRTRCQYLKTNAKRLFLDRTKLFKVCMRVLIFQSLQSVQAVLCIYFGKIPNHKSSSTSIRYSSKSSVATIANKSLKVEILIWSKNVSRCHPLKIAELCLQEVKLQTWFVADHFDPYFLSTNISFVDRFFATVFSRSQNQSFVLHKPTHFTDYSRWPAFFTLLIGFEGKC